MSEEPQPLGIGRLVRNYSIFASIIAGTIAVWSAVGWFFPFVLTKDWIEARAADEKQINHKFEQLGSRVERLENEVSQLSSTVLEGQELQLMAELRNPTITPEFRDRINQQLARVRFELERRRAAGFNVGPQ